MSTVAYRDGIMAGDTRAYAGFNLPMGQKMKIRQHPNGGMVGVTTTVPGLGERFLTWVCDTTNKTDEPDGEISLMALCVDANGDVFYYHDSLCPTGPLTAPFFAIGSGALAALGAMHRGATAEEAVEVASLCDVWTAPPIKTLTLKKPRKGRVKT